MADVEADPATSTHEIALKTAQAGDLPIQPDHADAHVGEPAPGTTPSGSPMSSGGSGPRQIKPDGR